MVGITRPASHRGVDARKQAAGGIARHDIRIDSVRQLVLSESAGDPIPGFTVVVVGFAPDPEGGAGRIE